MTRIRFLPALTATLLLGLATFEAVAGTVTAILPPDGSTAGGTAVTLVGSGFTGATAVSIGGAPVASFIVLSDTMIDAVTGAGTAGAADVVVTSTGGTGTGTGLYTYGLSTVPGGVVWTDQNTTAGATNKQWYSITSSADGSKLAAVVYGGDIWTSTDSGAHWTDQTTTSTTNTYWSSITSSADGSKLAAVASGGDIWTSTDSGVHWTNQTTTISVPTKYWSSITSSADGRKLAAVVYGGDIWTSTDSGAHWTDQTTTRSVPTKYWTSITSSADGRKLAAVVGGAGRRGDIWTSTDYGAHWTDQTTTPSAINLFWTSITSSAECSKLAGVVLWGDIWTSTDSGAHWTDQTTGSNAINKQWTSITSSADGSKLAAVIFGSGGGGIWTQGGGIWISTDSGAHWTVPNTPSQDWWTPGESWWSITSSADGGKLAAVVYRGDILTSSATTPVIANPVYTTTTRSASLGGYVTGNGGAPLMAMGVVYAPTALNGNPQVGGSQVTNLSAALNTGFFTVNATGLTPGTSYTFAVYATNSLGTAYTTPATTFTTIAAPSITGPASLPNWATNAPGYLQTLTTTGGSGPVTFAVTSGSLPAGLTLATNGALSGRPTVAGSYTFTVTATDTAGATGTQTYTNVMVISGAIVLSPSILPNWTASMGNDLMSTYWQTIASSGGTGSVTYAVTSGALPTGLTLATSGALSGMPSVAGAYTFTVTGTDATGATGAQTYTNVVIHPSLEITTATLSDGAIGVSGYSQTINTSGGTPPITLVVAGATSPPGMGQNTSTGAISGTPTAFGSFTFLIEAIDSVGATAWKGYYVNIWAVPAIVKSGVPNIAVTVGASPTNIDLSNYYNDADPADRLTYALVSNGTPAHGTSVLTGSNLQLRPGALGRTTIVVSATNQHYPTTPAVNKAFTLTTVTAPALGKSYKLTVNKQTGLLELAVTVTNTTGVDIAGVRITVTNLMHHITLSRATTAPNAVDYAVPIAADDSATVTLEFYSPTRSFGSYVPDFTLVTLTPPVEPPASGVGEETDQVVVLSPNVVLIEFAAIIGHSYQVQYSDDGMIWKLSPAGVKAGATKVQWIDRGPPYTATPPVTSPAVVRVYRVDDVTAK